MKLSYLVAIAGVTLAQTAITLELANRNIREVVSNVTMRDCEEKARLAIATGATARELHLEDNLLVKRLASLCSRGATTTKQYFDSLGLGPHDNISSQELLDCIPKTLASALRSDLRHNPAFEVMVADYVTSEEIAFLTAENLITYRADKIK